MEFLLGSPHPSPIPLPSPSRPRDEAPVVGPELLQLPHYPNPWESELSPIPWEQNTGTTPALGLLSLESEEKQIFSFLITIFQASNYSSCVSLSLMTNSQQKPRWAAAFKGRKQILKQILELISFHNKPQTMAVFILGQNPWE